MGIDIEGGELAVVGKVVLVRGGGSGKAVDDVAGDGDDGVGLGGVGVGEVVFLGAVFGTKVVEIAGREDSGIALLPGADVDARDGESVRRLGGAEKHGASIARRWSVDGERCTVDGRRWTVSGERWSVDGEGWTVDGQDVKERRSERVMSEFWSGR